jgi:hypothetical protein
MAQGPQLDRQVHERFAVVADEPRTGGVGWALSGVSNRNRSSGARPVASPRGAGSIRLARPVDDQAPCGRAGRGGSWLRPSFNPGGVGGIGHGARTRAKA